MYTITKSRNEYGGMVYTLYFEETPTSKELNEAVQEIDDCSFGWRVIGSKLDGSCYIVEIKIHND